MKKALSVILICAMLAVFGAFMAPYASAADPIDTEDSYFDGEYDGEYEDDSMIYGTYGELEYCISEGEVGIISCDTSVSGSYTIPSSIEGYPVTGILQEAFADCVYLTSVTIPKSVTYIGIDAFFNTAIYNNPNNWTKGVLYIGDCLIDADETVASSYTVKSGTRVIADFAFYYSTNLSSITIPSSVTDIAVNAFFGENKLSKITVSDSNKNYSSQSGVLFNKKKTELVIFPAAKTGSYTVPSSVKSIGYGAFFGCSGLKSITIPSGVTGIGNLAFFGCENLNSIKLPDSISNIGIGAFWGTGYYFNEDKWTNGVLYINNHLIQADEYLSGKYTVKSGTKTIADSAFSFCESLTDVVMPEGVVNIGSYVFDGCSSLKSITIPISVKSIGDDILSDCTSLTDVYYAGSTGDWDNISVEKEINEQLFKATMHYALSGYKYYVAFSGNCATSGSMSKITCWSESENLLTANAFKKKGYTFVGWNTKADGSGISYADKQTVESLSEKANATVTLYAQWEKTKYTITYNLNGGVNNEANPDSYYITTSKITLKNPTRTGYTFKGWYSNSNYKTKVTSIAQGSTGNKTLYAKWEKTKYTITYSLNGGTNSSSNPKSYYITTSDITLKNPTRKGYTFEGWYSDSSYTNKVETIEQGSSGNIKLYAKWSMTKYTITYNLNGGTNSSSNPDSYYITTSKITLKSPTRTGYTFKGWYTSSKYKTKVSYISKGSTGNKTLYAKWAKTKYTITYNLNGGSNSSSNPKSYYITTSDITLKNPTRKGYAFEGWYSDSSYTNKVETIEQGSTGNVKLYAKWSKIKYTITYNLNGGTNSSSNPDSYYVTSSKITLKNPTRTGYTFKGWYSNSNFKTKVSYISKGSTGDKTLYAKWSENTYTIKFNGNGSTSGKMSSLTNRKYSSEYTLTANTFKKVSKGVTYTFAGWNTKVDGTGISFADGATVSKLSSKNGATVTLYAQWVRVE